MPRQDTVPPLAPIPPDTLGRRFPGDTLAADTVPTDTPAPPPRLPALDDIGPTGWSAGVWRWDRRDLLRLPDLTLLQLLERVPGVLPIRAAPAGQAEGPSLFGANAGAVRYVVDGFELDPLTGPTFDPSRLPLLALESVTLERGITGARVRIVTLSPEDPRPQSVIEAATGDLDTNLFRGIFLAPSILGGPLALGFERLAADMVAPGSANQTTGWLKWTFVRDSAGVQLEYRQVAADRSGVGSDVGGDRADLALRARARLLGVTGEVYGGVTTVEEETGGLVLREGTPQGGVRLRAALPGPLPVEARGAFRLTSHPRLPKREAELELWAAPFRWVGFGGGATQAWWADDEASGRWWARGRLSPLPWVVAFGEAFGSGPLVGEGDAALRAFAGDDSPAFTLSREGYRAGAELVIGGLRLGGAYLVARADSVAAFGLAFDTLATRFAGGEATGYEATVRIPTWIEPVWLEAWYIGMDAPASWIYRPEHHWRAALVYHHLPLPSGNLELYARAEHVFRGAMQAPTEAGLARVAAFRSTNIELTVRVVTVRAFIRWENLRGRRLLRDLPDFPLPGQNVRYGVKWVFFN